MAFRFVALMAASDSKLDDFVKGVTEQALRLEADMPVRIKVRTAFPIRDDGAHSAQSNSDGVLELLMPQSNDLQAVLGAVDGLAARLGNVVNVGQSAAVVGAEHIIVPGMAPIQIHAGLRRSPRLSHEAFCLFWKHEFGRVASKIPRMGGYCQVHADIDATKAAAAASGLAVDDLDGIAVEWFGSSEQLTEAGAWAGTQSFSKAVGREFTVEHMVISHNAELSA